MKSHSPLKSSSPWLLITITQQSLQGSRTMAEMRAVCGNSPSLSEPHCHPSAVPVRVAARGQPRDRQAHAEPGRAVSRSRAARSLRPSRRPRCTPCVGLHPNTGRGDPESTWNTSGMLDSSFSEQPFRLLVAIPSLSLALILKCLARAA